jgi:hypothetical protein
MEGHGRPGAARRHCACAGGLPAVYVCVCVCVLQGRESCRLRASGRCVCVYVASPSEADSTPLRSAA